MRVKEKFFNLLTSEIEALDCWTACSDGENAKTDNWVDLAGYAACGGELEGIGDD